MTQTNMIQALNSAMDIAMARDPSVVVLGEDVGYFGGVFRVHRRACRKNMASIACSTRRSPKAASSPPLIGMAVNGLRPVAEIQFADYVYPGYDQIVSELARLRYRSARRFHRAGDDPHAQRRRHPRRADTLAEPRGAVRARLRHQGGHAIESLRRQGHADRRDRGSAIR